MDKRPHDTQDQGVARPPDTLSCSFYATSASSINQVESWFAELSRKQLQRRVDTSVRQLEADIRTVIGPAQQKPEALQMTKSADASATKPSTLCVWRTLDSRD